MWYGGLSVVVLRLKIVLELGFELLGNVFLRDGCFKSFWLNVKFNVFDLLFENIV